jgi:hypothetical protein
MEQPEQKFPMRADVEGRYSGVFSPQALDLVLLADGP